MINKYFYVFNEKNLSRHFTSVEMESPSAKSKYLLIEEEKVYVRSQGLPSETRPRYVRESS